MKKILKGSVIKDSGGGYHWVVEHRKGFIKCLEENGRETHVGESTAQDGDVIDGAEAMDIIRRIWY
jgi:hypothetical protein